MTRNTQLRHQVFLANVPYEASEADVAELFAANGARAMRTSILLDDAGNSRGRAFVEFWMEEDKERALQLDGTEWMGRRLLVRRLLGEDG